MAEEYTSTDPTTEERRSATRETSTRRSERDDRQSRPERDDRQSHPRRGGGGRRGQQRPKTTACSPSCIGQQVDKISYKQVSRLQRHITDRGKIRPRRQTRTCAKHQRVLAREIKRARYMALLPYTSEHSFTEERRRPERPRYNRR